MKRLYQNVSILKGMYLKYVVQLFPIIISHRLQQPIKAESLSHESNVMVSFFNYNNFQGSNSLFVASCFGTSCIWPIGFKLSSASSWTYICMLLSVSFFFHLSGRILFGSQYSWHPHRSLRSFQCSILTCYWTEFRNQRLLLFHVLQQLSGGSQLHFRLFCS